MMMKIMFLCVLLAVVAAQKDEVTDRTELVFGFLVFRHGDRTPATTTLAYSNDVTKLSELSAPYGYGQLTDFGKQRSYELGEYIRSRYGELLSPQYNRSEVYLRSTDSTRTKMALLAALAAVYSPGENAWSQDLNWTPVPYTTVPTKYDFNTAFVNCPVFMDVFYSSFNTQPPSMKKYKNVLSLISEYVGVDLNQFPLLVYSVFELLISQLSLGLPLAPEVQKQLPKIEEAAGKAIDIVLGNKSYIALQAGLTTMFHRRVPATTYAQLLGSLKEVFESDKIAYESITFRSNASQMRQEMQCVLLNEFFTKAADVIAGTDTQRLRVYSAHDINVYSLEAVTKISDKQGIPKYGSAYSLEVRRVVKTGKYVVLPVYLPEPGSPVKYLKIKGCSQLCGLKKFQKITSPYH